MRKTLNLVIEDRSDPRETKVIVEPFHILDETKPPEQALRNAVKEFVSSGTEESKTALHNANGYYNWGDVITTVPDDIFAKHGLLRIMQEAVDIVVDHDEVLCDGIPEDNEQ